jgi:adenylate kinase
LETAKEIVRQDGKVLLTTHMSLQTPFGFYPGLPLDVLQALKPKAIVLLEASHTEIALRHEKDTTRIRGYDFERNIDQYQTFNRMYAVSYSANSGARVKIVHNAQGKMDDAANELKNLLMGL